MSRSLVHYAGCGLLAVFLFLPGHGISQVTGFNLKKALARRDVATVKKSINTFISENSGSAEATYLQAVMEQDAQKAMEMYNQIKAEFPDSPLAAYATLQMGHYHFARGLYISARRFFLEIVEKYADSEILPEAIYFAAAGMCAAHKMKTCRSELENFLRQYSGSTLAKLAKKDLRELGNGSPAPQKTRKKLLNQQGKYTVQLGAFNKANNALNLRNYFTKIGFQVEIREIDSNGKTQYVVWLGSFETEEAARAFGNNIKKDHGKPFRVVSK